MHHLLRKLFKQQPGVPDYRVGPQYDLAGAGAFVYQREFADPLVSPIGPATNVRKFMRVTQLPQVYYYGGQTALTGIGGTQAGRISLQPLDDGSLSG